MIKIIVARSKNNVIGVEKNIPWHIKEDFKMFKENTVGHIIVVGRTTLETFPKLLPNRETWCISSKEQLVKTFSSVKEAISFYKDSQKNGDLRHLFICGGTKVYEEALQEANEILITEVDIIVPNGTAFFNINPETYGFKKIEEKIFQAKMNTENDLNFSFNKYQK